jgi:hypothetical protein
MGKLKYHMENGREQAPGWLNALSVMESCNDLSPSSRRYKVLVQDVDYLINHSKDNSNYLEHGKDDSLNRLPRLFQRRERLVSKAEQHDPSFSAEPAPTSSGGCFIATAAMGDFNHPHVLHLRRYRDANLGASSAGRLFVKAYYLASPPLANVISKSRILQGLAYQTIVRPAVAFTKWLS